MEYSYFVFPSKYTKYNWSFRRLILNYPGNVLPTSERFWDVFYTKMKQVPDANFQLLLIKSRMNELNNRLK